MLHTSMVYILIRTFPECILVLFSGCILLNLNIPKSKVFKTGIIYALIVSFIRILPIHFGIHTLLSIILTTFILLYFSNKNLIDLLATTCCIFIALLFSEVIYLNTFTNIFRLHYNLIVDNFSLSSALLSLPSLLIFLILVKLINIIQRKFNKFMSM